MLVHGVWREWESGQREEARQQKTTKARSGEGMGGAKSVADPTR